MRLLISFISLIYLLIAGGCASKQSIYLTLQLQDRFNMYNISPEQVQYYNDKKLVLQRNVTKNEASVMGGKVKFINGQLVERIVIKKRTPGVCVASGEDYLDVAFEPGDNRKLRFVSNYKGRFQVSAIEWKKGYGMVEYDTTFFYIMPGGERTNLLVRKQDVVILEKKERVAPGRNVGN